MKKIMIIDDELDILNVLKSFLARSGKFEVEGYSNPKLALGKAKSRHFDLVISDIMMPETDGMQILEDLKQFNHGIKVVLMTAYSTDLKVEQSKNLGVDAYLEKPFSSLKAVEDKISSLLGV